MVTYCLKRTIIYKDIFVHVKIFPTEIHKDRIQDHIIDEYLMSEGVLWRIW